MHRKYLYYLLTFSMGVVVVSGRLNTQLVVVNELSPGEALFPRELLIMGFGSLFYALGSFFLAPLSDRLGRLPCIAGAGLFIATFFGLLGFGVLGPFQLWQFFMVWGMVSLGFSVFFTGIEGLLSDYQDHRTPLARRLGLYCVCWSSGGAIGAFLSGRAKEMYGPELVFRAVCLLCLALVIIALADLWRHGMKKLGVKEIGQADIRPEAAFHASMARVGLCFGSLAFAALAASFPRFARDFHGLSEGRIGTCFSLITFNCFITFVWFPRWKRWHYAPGLQVGLQALMFIGLALLIFAPSGNILLIYAALILFGAGYGFCYFFSIYYSLLVPEGHSKSGGIHEAFLGLGKLFGPFLALGLIFLAGQRELLPVKRLGAAAVVLSALAIIVSLGIQTIMVKNKKNTRLFH